MNIQLNPIFKACVLAMVALGQSGCITNTWGVSDLEFVSVHAIDLRDMPKADREFEEDLRQETDFVVEFESKSGTDIYRFANRFDYNMGSNASLCKNGQYDMTRELIIDPYLYGDRGMVHQSNNPVIKDKSRSRTFHFYIKGTIEEKYVASGRFKFAYDLTKQPHDICFFLDGGAFFAVFLPDFSSNTVVVPREAVTKAWETARSKLEQRDLQK